MSSSIVLVILVTSFATYLSRFLGVVSSEKIKETMENAKKTTPRKEEDKIVKKDISKKDMKRVDKVIDVAKTKKNLKLN